jgi:hypothetical protein
MKYLLFGFILSMRKLSNTFLYCSENKDKEEIYNIYENINKKNLLDELEKNTSIHKKLDLLKKSEYHYIKNNNLTNLFNNFY